MKYRCEVELEWEDSWGSSKTSHTEYITDDIEAESPLEAAKKFQDRHGHAPETAKDDGGGLWSFCTCFRCGGVIADDCVPEEDGLGGVLICDSAVGFVLVCRGCLRHDDKTLEQEFAERHAAKEVQS